MSLFSRLDRVRNNRESKENDDGAMFAPVDLGPRGDATQNQPAPSASAPQNAENSPSPETTFASVTLPPQNEVENSPENLAPATPPPSENAPPETPEPQEQEIQSAPTEAIPETVAEATIAENPAPENSAPENSVAEESAPENLVVEETVAEETSELPAPMAASAPDSAPEVAAPKSPFERLMAERKAAMPPAGTPIPEAPRPNSLLERLKAQEAKLRAQAADALKAEPPKTESEKTESVAEGVGLAPQSESLQSEAPPNENLPSEPLDLDAEIPDEYLPDAPASEAPEAPEASEKAEANEKNDRLEAIPFPLSPEKSPENAPETPEIPAQTPRTLSAIVAGTRGFADRLAAREALDRELQIVPAEPVAVRPTGAELVKIDAEANLSEKERKVRVLYRQKHLIFDSVLGALDPRFLQNPVRETVRPAIEKAVDGALREFNLAIENGERIWMVEEFVRELTDVGPLVPLLDDPGVSKIIVTGANDVSVEKLGHIERLGISFRDDDHLLSLVRRIAEMTGGRIDAKVPLLDRPLPDGSRIRAKVPPIAPQPSLTIEKSTGNPFVALRRAQVERSRSESLPYNQLRERIQRRLLREIEGNTAATLEPEKLRVQVEELIGQVIIEEKVAVTRAERAALVMDLLNEIVGLGPLEPLLNDPEVDEVMVNGPYQIYVERKGKLELSNQRFRDNAHAMQVIERIIAPLGRRIDEKSPMVDGRLRDGSRFNAIIPPLALGGPTMTIRKFARDPFTMTDLINFGTLTRDAAQFLHAAVEGKLNIIVSGGTGSGKTTTLNVLSSFIPSADRIVTIEDAAELQLRQEHTVRLETRPPNIEGVGEITIRDLVRNALRMRPDRIVVGECRGGEALDMLQAMNTGHDGSLTTAHSNGPRDTLKRLETMVMMSGFDLPVKAIREQVAMAVHLIVHQERMRDGKRRITAITEIVGMEGDVITLQDLFRFEQERIDEEGRIHGALQPTGLRPKNWDVIVDHGVEISMDLFQRPGEPTGRARLGEGRLGARH